VGATAVKVMSWENDRQAHARELTTFGRVGRGVGEKVILTLKRAWGSDDGS